jgi:hypothetical protein
MLDLRSVAWDCDGLGEGVDEGFEIGGLCFAGGLARDDFMGVLRLSSFERGIVVERCFYCSWSVG